ncbi:hypothetical protein FOA52_011865 [Chlamydomonas sp. UWO 241]|nr:hypothetical protein FOA52_011865 [Chlamydomonas sp. UWO 241]
MARVCVSVIEARHVSAADMDAPLDFYVRLRLGGSEVRTDTSLASALPKFLKDVRMAVPAPDTDVLRIDILQLGPAGDLVVGSTEVALSSLVGKGTLVQWLDLRAFNQAAGAKLCCVMRYLEADAHRSMTPSYVVATRGARAGSSDCAPVATDAVLAAPGLAAAKVLFSDGDVAPVAPVATVAAVAAVAAVAPAAAAVVADGVVAPAAPVAAAEVVAAAEEVVEAEEKVVEEVVEVECPVAAATEGGADEDEAVGKEVVEAAVEVVVEAAEGEEQSVAKGEGQGEGGEAPAHAKAKAAPAEEVADLEQPAEEEFAELDTAHEPVTAPASAGGAAARTGPGAGGTGTPTASRAAAAAAAIVGAEVRVVLTPAPVVHVVATSAAAAAAVATAVAVAEEDDVAECGSVRSLGSAVSSGSSANTSNSSGRRRRHKGFWRAAVPAQIAAAGGAALGMALYFAKAGRSAAYAGAFGSDEVCLIGACYDQGLYERFKRRIAAQEL